MALRDFALVQTRSQWLRCTHEGTHVDQDGVLGLTWKEPSADGAPARAPKGPPAGLAFDSRGRLYRSVPEEGRVERSAPGSGYGETSRGGHGHGTAGGADLLDLFHTPEPEPSGLFRPRAPSPGALEDPRGLAVDEGDRLFLCEAGRRRILVYDLPTRRLIREVPVEGARPVALAGNGDRILAFLEGRPAAIELTARDLIRELPVEDGPGTEEAPATRSPERPRGLAVMPHGDVVVLDDAGSTEARAVFLAREERLGAAAVPRLRARLEIPVPGATGLACDGAGHLVVARHPGETFLRFALVDGEPVTAEPLRARNYDGRGIVVGPDGRIWFWSGSAPARAIRATVRYVRQGLTTTFHLDAGEYRTQWGRIFLDACVPEGCSVRVQAAATDDPQAPIPETGLSSASVPGGAVHLRSTGRELPWAPHEPGSPFGTFEAPVRTGPGRYLQVTLELDGTTRRTPKIRSLRIEHPGHDLLGKLPGVFSRSPEAASFLRRYLAMADGFLQDLDLRAQERHALLDPESAPEEVLPWLAGFLGLVLDDRWPLEARRTAIQEAPWLFRFRGTVPGLRRFLEIYAGKPVILVEHFRLRGMGGVLVGEDGSAFSRAVVGGGLRVGGEVGGEDPRPLEGTTADAFRTHAHRFTVLVGRALDAEGMAVVRRILELHRPAHTSFQICTSAAGMRVGRGLHVELSSFVGRTAGFSPLRLGSSLVGRDGVVGGATVGTAVGGRRLGQGTEVG